MDLPKTTCLIAVDVSVEEGNALMGATITAYGGHGEVVEKLNVDVQRSDVPTGSERRLIDHLEINVPGRMAGPEINVFWH